MGAATPTARLGSIATSAARVGSAAPAARLGTTTPSARLGPAAASTARMGRAARRVGPTTGRLATTATRLEPTTTAGVEPRVRTAASRIWPAGASKPLFHEQPARAELPATSDKLILAVAIWFQ